jgi:hypothetical protein
MPSLAVNEALTLPFPKACVKLLRVSISVHTELFAASSLRSGYLLRGKPLRQK